MDAANEGDDFENGDEAAEAGEPCSFRCECGDWISCIVGVGRSSGVAGEADISCGDCGRSYSVVVGFLE